MRNLHIEGATKFYSNRQAVFDELIDPHRFVKVIPGKEGARVVDDSRAEARVRVDAPESKRTLLLEVSAGEAEDGQRSSSR